MLIHRSHTRYACALLLAALWLGLTSSPAQAADCLSSGVTSSWGNSATWTACNGVIPTSADTATIQNAHTVTVNGTFTVASVTVNAPGINATTLLDVASGQTLTVTGALAINGGTGNRKAEVRISGTGTLTVGTNLTPATPAAGNAVVTFTGAGTLNIGGDFGASATFTPGTGTVVYNGSGGQAVGTYTYNNLAVTKTAGTASLTGNITLNSDLAVSAGTLDLGVYTANRATAGGTLTVAGGATLRVGATLPANYGTYTFNATSTVHYNQAGGTQDVSVQTYGHLLLDNGGTKRMLAGLTTIAGNFTLGAATTYGGVTNNPLVNLAGNFINNGTFNSGTGAFTFNGTTAQTISGNATSFTNLVIDNTSVVGVTAQTSLAIGAFDIKASHTFNAGALSHSISGSFINNGTFNHDGSTFTFNGTAVQSLTGATTFHNLTMNNTAGLTTAGLTINNDVTINNTLTFTNGKITTGTTTSPEPYPNTLTALANCADSVSGAGATTGWVVGNLKKSVPAGASICIFQVGGANLYSRIEVEFPDTTTAGNLTGAAMPYTATPSGHPKITETDINPARNVNRFWTLKNSTPTNFFTSYSATFHFNAADIDSGADPLEFVIRRYSPFYQSPETGTWSNVTADEAQLTTTYSKGTGITGTGDFAVGNSNISAFLREREWVYQRELYYQ